jgi:hypothetical protein
MVTPSEDALIEVAFTAGVEVLGGVAARQGLGRALALFARVLNPARPLFHGKLGANRLAYTSVEPWVERSYDRDPPQCAVAPPVQTPVSPAQHAAWAATLRVRFETVFGDCLWAFVGEWQALFSALVTKQYTNDLEARYEKEIGRICAVALTLWRARWAEHAEQMRGELTAVDGDGLFHLMALQWPDAMIRLAWGDCGTLDWVSPSEEEIESGIDAPALEQGAYTFGWAFCRATEHVTDRLEAQGSEQDATDLMIREILLSAKLTVTQAQTAPKSAHLNLVNQRDRAKTEDGGLFRLAGPGQAVMRQICAHFRKWLTFERMAKTQFKYSLLEEVIVKTKAAPAVRAAVVAMTPESIRTAPNFDAAMTRLLCDLIQSYARMEGKAFASDLNDHVAERLQHSIALRKQVKMAALRLQLATPEQRAVIVKEREDRKAAQKEQRQREKVAKKQAKQDASRKRKRDEAQKQVAATQLESKPIEKLRVKELRSLLTAMGREQLPSKHAELLALYEALRPAPAGLRRSTRDVASQ